MVDKEARVGCAADCNSKDEQDNSQGCLRAIHEAEANQEEARTKHT